MIQVAAQLIAHVGDRRAASPAARLGTEAAAASLTPIERREIARASSAARCRWRGTPPAAAPAPRSRADRVEPASHGWRSARSPARRRRPSPRHRNRRAPRAARRSARASSASAGSSVHGLAEVVERRVAASPFWRSTPRQLAIRETRCRASWRSRCVYARTASSSRPPRAAARALASPLLGAAEPQHVDARRRTSVSDGSAASAASNAASALRLAVQRQQRRRPRPTSADGVVWPRVQQRAIEVRPSAAFGSLRASSR